MKLNHIPRVPLAFLPTPLEFLPNLTKHLGGPQIWMKRDDMTGLATGGNKARKLEFLLADAIQNKADTLLTFGAVQSNHCRMTAAAACKYNLKSFLILSGSRADALTGNLLLDEIMGCEYLFLPDFTNESNMESMQLAIFDKVQELNEQGRSVYMIPPGGSTPLGDVGYFLAAIEMFDQAREMGLRIDHIFVAMGSSGTQAGLLAGVKYLDMPATVHGVAVSKKGSLAALGLPPIETIVNQIGDLLDVQLNAKSGEVTVHYDYYGETYGKSTPACIEAIKLLARLEGVFLDPVYTGKTMAGMLDLVRKGTFRKDENLVFIHTGGYPGIFPHGESFRERV
ncbi:MAG: D-cysteine desulfhydrase family protein [Candidatus Abyssobacteria bacterium SURF_5]|uniref:D-cysteine desulfhydrase family protein n=1 Tax=Abyssobacteria bacterium (strain SURF_5) TaxID=2093360 RepID=A0A3A4NFJ4_ABYX5|nr:MAG: D-cysteine desulfhydrase family protein [Candidatus Abyssubacteria bacterium SURF_5]